MIGRLWIETGKQPVEVVLSDDLTWSCDDENYALLLNTVFPPPPTLNRFDQAASSEALHHLYRAGERLGARVQVSRGAEENTRQCASL